MAHRKRKPSRYSVQKQDRAQHKNDFLRRVRKILPHYLDQRLISFLPPFAYDYIYMIRFGSPIVTPAEGHKIPKELIKEIKYVLTLMLKDKNVPLYANGPDVSVYDFITIVLTLWLFARKIKESDFSGAAEIKAAISLKTENDSIIMNALNYVCVPANVVCMMVSNMWNCLYWSKFDLLPPDDKIDRPQYRINIIGCVPQRISVQIDGFSRPITRAGGCDYFLNSISWLTFDPSLLSNSASLPDKPLDVYIQSHAIQRLSERIDCIETGFTHLNVYKSINQPRIIPSGYGYDLIEFRINEFRAGYFIFSIVKGVLLIRSFLFIINNGTPEGAKLQKITGLGRLDKKYLAIDRLSAFMSSDIGTSSKVKEILNQCGCDSLLLLSENLKKDKVCIKYSSQQTASLIEKYLQKAQPQTDYRQCFNTIFAEKGKVTHIMPVSAEA